MSDDVRIEYPDGTYTGEATIDGKTPEGVGMFRWSDGTVYVGRWHSGKRQGHGTLKRPGKWVYDGDFEDDALTGRGIMTWSDGTRYEGDFHDGRMQGRGKLTWPDGRRYEGEFVNNQMEGTGTLTSPDGKVVYSGEWIQSCPVAMTQQRDPHAAPLSNPLSNN
jgi:hypothetical protein